MGECISCKIKPRETRNRIDITMRECYGLPQQIQSIENFPIKFPKKLIINDRFYLKRFNCVHSSDKLLKLKTNAGECLICWKKINKDKMALRSCCEQNYHVDCFFEWIKVRNICPICRGFIILLKNNVYINGRISKKVSYDTYTYKLFDFNNQELNINCIFEPEFEDIGFFNNEDNIEEVESRSQGDTEELELVSCSEEDTEELELVSCSEEEDYLDSNDIIDDEDYSIENNSLEQISLPVLEEELLKENYINLLNNASNINLPNSIGNIELRTELEVS